MAKTYVKALYDYFSGEVGDLSLKAGDIIQVLNQVDENWIKGEYDGNIGLFPANFVEPAVSPAADGKEGLPSTLQETGSVPTGKTVVAKETYISGDDGVLTFFRGDELIFLGRVDEYWCRGSFAGEVGLFPTHLVDGLDDVSISPQVTDAIKTIPLQEKNIEPTLEEPHAKTLFEFKGLSEFELSFPEGQIVVLTKDIDDEWYEGTYNGSTGIFPKSFVEVKVPLPKEQVPSITHSVDVPYAIAIYPFVGETSSEISFREGDIITLHYWVSPEWIQGECNGHIGIFPSTFVQIEKELLQDFEELSGRVSYLDDSEGQLVTQNEVVNSVFKTGDKALAIYSYATDIEGDLHLDVGDLIWIEQVIDEEWVLGRKDEDNVGLCPAVFLELHCDEPLDSFEKSIVNVNENMLSVERTKNQQTNSYLLNNTSDNQYRDSGQKDESGSVKINSLTNSYPSSSPTPALKVSSELNQPILNHIPVSKTESTNTIPALTPAPEIRLSVDTPPSEKQTIFPTKNELSNKITTKTPRVKPMSLSLGSKPPLGPKPLILPKPDFLKKPVKPALPPKPVTPTEKGSGFSKQNTINGNGWVTFDDENEATTSSQPTRTQHKPRPPAAARNKISGESYRMSYKTLLNKSLEEERVKSLPPEPSKRPPVPPPRVDLVTSRVAPDSLESKLMEQAAEFEKSSSRQNSPSLNELRAKSQKPVPAQRSTQLARPLSYRSDGEEGGANQGFSILDELDDQITKLRNELQKENQVLSGMEVLIQAVNKDTSRRGELESKKGKTERKIEELKRQLKKTEDQKKRLVKQLAGYSSQEEIRLKILQLQETIKENTDTKNDLQSLLSECQEEEVRNELHENITFCDEAIKNLQSELNSLVELVAVLEGKLKEEPGKDVSHRKKVINEILNTEKSFAQDLNVCLKSFKMQLIQWKVDIIDCELLFGNMDEVAALSSRLLQRLEDATNDVDINAQVIGKCFVDFSEEMTVVYGKYCRNHDEAITFLEKAAGNEEVQQYLSKCLESIRESSNCWDLSSFLIKPVQRILKYPLLLNELLKNTPDDHPDKPGLIKAIELMTIAANDVNEFKRRKELVQKYQKMEESGLSTKFQKFTWHSVLKKSSRFNQRITQLTGLGSQTVDEKFNENERFFYQIEKTAKNLIKNITQYFEQFENVHEKQVETAENIVDFCKENSTAKEIHEYKTAQRFIGEDLVDKLKHVLNEEVLSPLNTLINLFQGPHRLIQKRHDKCLDYDSRANKMEKIKDREKWRQAKDELEFAKKNYEALNAQLLDELPVLNTKSLKFLQTCITNFACVHKNFFVEALDQFSPSVQLSVVNSAGNMDIMSDFFSQNKMASHEVFQLVFTPKKNLTLTRPARPNVSPQASRSNLSVDDKHYKQKTLKRSSSENKRKAPLPPADDPDSGLRRSRTVSAGDRNLLMKKRVEIDPLEGSTTNYHMINPGNPTYIVKYTFTAEAATELSVSKDDVITVLEYHDAFGHSEWWKVEHNGKEGFVPSSFLVPHSMVPQPGLNSVVQISGQTSNGSVLKTGRDDYLVKYDFEPQSSRELGMMSGDVVNVVKQSDASGSNEWWLVNAKGKQGYVPSSYLIKR